MKKHNKRNNNEIIKKRVLWCAKYYVEHNSTVREVADIFGVSKSTVSYDFIYRLKHYSIDLYDKVQKISLKNYNEKHISGGLATKNKYKSNS